jgi:hypothetical protein
MSNCPRWVCLLFEELARALQEPLSQTERDELRSELRQIARARRVDFPCEHSIPQESHASPEYCSAQEAAPRQHCEDTNALQSPKS